MSVFSGALVLSKQKYIEEDLFFLSRDFVKAVAMYKAKGDLSDADCYPAELRKLRKAEGATGDPELQKLKEEITISWRIN